MPAYFDFEVSLIGAEPRVWRRFLIHSNTTFMDLHDAIQDACGWLHSHLFAFESPEGSAIAGLPHDAGFGEPDPDAAGVRLPVFFKNGANERCLYTYDFGDSWEHDVVLRGQVDSPDRFGRRLTDGARAFPLEDCGGLWGYEECVKVAQGYEGETSAGDAASLREWLGGWTPEAFDLVATKRSFDR
ncbi:MAG: plasmid pRiA4b ORF-3 family protein [Actinomycetota bacterium]